MSGQIETPADAGLLNAPVGQIAASRAGAASVFQTFGIDFCCQGKRTLAEALAGQGIAPSPVLAALMSAAAEPLDDWRAAPTPALIDHIKTRYHAVHLAELPNLRDLAAKVEATHRKHPAVPDGLAETLSRMIAELRLHQQREEVVLFPLLAQGGGEMARAAIQVMRAEHEDHGAVLAGIEAITGGRVAPQGACATWRALYLGLGKFHDDLMMHVHLENNVLFPRFETTEGPGNGNPISGCNH
ncbi:MAG: iron-sulfur cluster repair di-iron protein [Acidiphilium sp. 37-67-22]|nr:MAG: iron-sulfur cluster repair di-iron protein [Acidiphilium sp. 21-66-27]OYW12679.1 MAG: iron-sulfur cluster repair di-iron protein [Acidiphilium sp. 37-67-22]HQT72442.1 iron-sulfur cluster repair di-iron protein [Acidiphilium sp.]HQU11258.1 iron-sulfur cluster repair di-iron protein [Acidiphilium sp.]